MRFTPKFAAIVTALVIVWASPVSAAEITVPANRESAINFITGVTASCRTSAKPKMKVVKAPMHGSVRFEWMKYKIRNISKLCDGRPAWGMTIFFKPQSGFRGKDSLTIGASMQRYEQRSDTQYKQGSIDIVVK